MPKFKLIKQLEKNLKLVELENPTNFITKWFKKFRIKEINKRICILRNSMKKK
jgi:hypothetical protein